MTDAAAREPVDVTALIDGSRLRLFHFRVIGLCAALIFFDGFDLQAVGYAAPAMAKALGLSQGMMGVVFSTGQLGLMAGGLVFGLAGDRWGRKRVFIFCGLLFGVASLATALSTGYQALLASRLVAGFGLGGATPIAITIASDYCPKRVRAALTMIMYCGFTIGGVAGGVVNAWVVGRGWPAVFVVGGTIPILLAPLLLVALPESLNYLVSRGTRGAEIARILGKLAGPGRWDPGSRFVMANAYEPRFQVPELFREGLARRTIILWAIFFIALITLFSFSNWLPTLLSSVGMSPGQVVAITATSQGGGLVGSIVAARLIISFRPFTVAAAGYLLSAILLVVMAQLGSSYLGYLAVGFCLNFCLIGVQNIVNAMSGQLYPPKIRATGVGWGIGVGRIGGVIGPTIVGGLLAFHWGASQLFIFAALPIVVTAALCLVLSAVLERAGGYRPDRPGAWLSRAGTGRQGAGAAPGRPVRPPPPPSA